jgi:hypothetical protein
VIIGKATKTLETAWKQIQHPDHCRGLSERAAWRFEPLTG